MMAVVVMMVIIMTPQTSSVSQPFVDYQPGLIEPCPSQYKCGAQTRDQVALENRLFSDLREENTYDRHIDSSGELYYITAEEAEPQDHMMKREEQDVPPMPEGTYVEHDEWNKQLSDESKRRAEILDSQL
jgi:hypothetical protein